MSFFPPQMAAVLKEKPAAILFSGGKDSIAMADMMHEEGLLPKLFVYFYFVPGLSFVESVLRHYSRLWQVDILRYPSDEALSLMAQMKGARKIKYNESDVLKALREDLSDTWLVSGAKKKDSLARRGMLSKLPNGVDSNRKVVYPLIDWSDRQVMVYCKQRKLKLPITYSMGAKNSVWVPDIKGLIWIKANFPRDYDRIIAVFPILSSMVFKHERQYARK
jgi:3'-phosphoadenosine 5'-phosphosulfate sulfotransferase (PAPS reductase)/FAD synthetase